MDVKGDPILKTGSGVVRGMIKTLIVVGGGCGIPADVERKET